jgi:hypothetical protein
MEVKRGKRRGWAGKRWERKIWVEKGKLGNRGMSKLVLRQNGEGSYVIVRWKKKMKKIKVKI